MSERQIEAGQIYRDRDSRSVRYVLIDSLARKDGAPAVWCLPCTVSGKLLDTGRTTRIKTANFHSRFQFVGEKLIPTQRVHFDP